MERDKALRVAKEAVKGSLFIFAGNTSSTIILTISSIIMARLLGPSDYGLFSVALIAPSLMLLFTDFGVSPALTRFTARLRTEGKSESVGSLIRTGLIFQLAMSILISLMTFLLADVLATYLLNRPDMGFLVKLSSLVIIGNALIRASNSVFMGLDETDKAALVSIARAAVKAIFAPTLIVLGFNIVGALVGHILGYLVAGAIGAILAIKLSKHQNYNSEDDQGVIQNLFPMIKYGTPLYASTLVISLLSQYQSIILAKLASNAEIGNYSVVSRFSSAIALLTMPISTVLFPAFSKLNPTTDMQELRGVFKNSLKYTLLLIIPASTFIAVSSKELISLFYGSDYTKASLYLMLYSITFLYLGFSLVLRSFFNGIGRTDISLKATLIQLPAILVLTPTLTWLYKVPGFIYALIISSTPPLAYLAWMAHRRYDLQLNLGSIARICAASLISSTPTIAITLCFHSSPLIKVTLGAITFVISYLTVIPITRAIRHEDVDNIELITKDIKLVSKLSRIALSYEEKILSIYL